MATYPKKSTLLEEQESTLNIYRTDDYASIYTCDTTMITKLDKLCEEHPDDCKIDRQDDYAKWYKIPKSYIKFHAPHVLTEEHKEKLRQNSRLYGYKRHSNDDE